MTVEEPDETGFSLEFRAFTGTVLAGDFVPVVMKAKPAIWFDLGMTIVSATQVGPSRIRLETSANPSGHMMSIPPFLPQIRTESGGYCAPIQSFAL